MPEQGNVTKYLDLVISIEKIFRAPDLFMPRKITSNLNFKERGNVTDLFVIGFKTVVWDLVTDLCGAWNDCT